MPLTPLPSELKTLPAYTLAEAAAYIGASPETLRRWFRGSPPVISPGGALKKAAVAPILPTDAGPREPISFIDMIEAHVLFSIRKGYGFPMKRIKLAMEYLSKELDGNLMFLAHQDFYHDSKDLFLGTDATLLSLSEGGQIADKTILASGLHQITYGLDGYADEFFPTFNNVAQRDFAVNPAINYGKISIVRLGVEADVLASRHDAGEKMADLAEDYGATPEEIVQAIRWHDRLAA